MSGNFATCPFSAISVHIGNFYKYLYKDKILNQQSFRAQYFIEYRTYEPPHDKTNKMTVRPAKTQISLGIRPVWPESSLCTQWAAKEVSFLHADSDWADAQADLSLCWAHMPFCWFCHDAAITLNNQLIF